jgi:hypothetical protein
MVYAKSFAGIVLANNPLLFHKSPKFKSWTFSSFSISEMAALRLGVGDVFTVCKSVVDLCAKATTSSHDDMRDLRMVVAEIQAMREHLDVIHARMEGKCSKHGVHDEL